MAFMDVEKTLTDAIEALREVYGDKDLMHILRQVSDHAEGYPEPETWNEEMVVERFHDAIFFINVPALKEEFSSKDEVDVYGEHSIDKLRMLVSLAFGYAMGKGMLTRPDLMTCSQE